MGAVHTSELTKAWGDWSQVSLYLDRCQVDTPDALVKATWDHVTRVRSRLGKVVDFGAGDGRFAAHGSFDTYVGYEIDTERCATAQLPRRATLINDCAFSEEIDDADLCIGNPPFVRNQDLPEGWRARVSSLLERRAGIQLSGLANAWQYFFLLSLLSCKSDGLCALVIPYEWVSRPSAHRIREFIQQQRWRVSVFRLVDTTFDSVLTTSSITLVDKSKKDGRWSYYEEDGNGQFVRLSSPSGSDLGVIPYARRSEVCAGRPRATRGLSPGTQKVLTLTEGERVRTGLMINRDVVPCVTTLRHLPTDLKVLDERAFDKFYRSANLKYWLVRTDKKPSKALQGYFDSVAEEDYQTATCLERNDWWRFKFPASPDMLIAQSFRGTFPKTVTNEFGVKAVGGVCGIFDVTEEQAPLLLSG